MLDMVIASGKVVFPGQKVQKVNIGVRGERIAGFFDAESTPEAGRVIDATGWHVFPGAIDPHVHLGIYNPYLEDFEVDTQAAALGGYTTIVNYYRHKESYLGTIAKMTEEAAEVSLIDFAFSLGLLRQAHWDEFEEAVRETGVTSWKFYRQYEGRVDSVFGIEDALTLNDAELLETIRRFAELSDKLLVCVHCENMDIARRAAAMLQAKEQVEHTLAEFAKTSPSYAEADNVLQTLHLAYLAGGPGNVYIVHLSSGHSVDILERCYWLVEETGTVIETTPHYLNLTKNAPAGLFAKVGPPIQSEWDQQRLWEGVEQGLITAYGGDHIPCRPVEKKGGQDLWETKYGFGGIGTEFSLMLSEGYHKRGVPLEQIAVLTSQQPAISFGLYPRKGAMVVGADADFALVDLSLERTITPDMPEVTDGYSVYEGMTTKGWPVKTVLRGQVIADHGKVVEKAGYGQYLRREI
ncbi:MAG: dihydroorotase family protein [Anaerolineae bacterium]